MVLVPQEGVPKAGCPLLARLSNIARCPLPLPHPDTISPYGGRDCVKSLRPSYTGLSPQNAGFAEHIRQLWSGTAPEITKVVGPNTLRQSQTLSLLCSHAIAATTQLAAKRRDVRLLISRLHYS